VSHTDLFPSGRAAVSPHYKSLFGRIAAALGQVAGPVLVTGHTDNVPIKSARFRSNWDLSRQRALAVQDILAQEAVLQGRLRAEGKADTDPLVPNTSRENRAINRRVEIQLVKGDRA
jgi:type VI secretion system protein ImpK